MRCELAVEIAFLKRNFSLVQKRWRTPFGELDLLLCDPKGHWYAIEVKTRSSDGVLGFRVGQKQLNRLRRIHQWLILQKSETRFFVAFVNPLNQIKMLELSDIHSTSLGKN